MDDDRTQDALFLDLPSFIQPAKATEALPPAPPRLRTADRTQVELRPCALEGLLDAEHPARIAWETVERWDLSRFLDTLQARGEKPGRAATDPKILISLWLYAYSRGVGNGRELDRLCRESDPYRWLAGGVSLNYHTLNDFRVNHEKALDDLLTQMLAVLIHEDLVSVERISNDGTRIRAGAGRKSFKKREQLEQDLHEARTHVEAVKHQAQDPNLSLQRQKAAQRAVRERVERLEQAMVELAKVEKAKEEQKEKASKHTPAKASTTDPEARIMRQPDMGSRPGYNVQLAVACEGRAIVGVDVTNAGSDVHEGPPMLEQVEERTGHKVNQQLMDGGFIGLEAVEAAAGMGVTVYAPVPKPKKDTVDPHEPKKTDAEAVAQWRVRMGTQEAQAIYKERASTVETANAECKTYRGLRDVLVRGVRKVRCVALWSALAYNLTHFGVLLG